VDLIDFAHRESTARGLIALALDAVIETLHLQRDIAHALNLRVVQRMLNRTGQPERQPVRN
jgi:hypothetical protein